jgi:hypothetical protein
MLCLRHLRLAMKKSAKHSVYAFLACMHTKTVLHSYFKHQLRDLHSTKTFTDTVLTPGLLALFFILVHGVLGYSTIAFQDRKKPV